MKDPSPGCGPSPHGSSSSLTAVTRNVNFYREGGSNEHLPWSTPADCHLSAVSENKVPLLRSVSNASVLTSLSADLTPSDSHFFEVLYIGKVKVSQRKVPDTLIDDALFKFDQHEAEKARQIQMRRNSLLSSQATSLSSDPDSLEDLSTRSSFVPIRESISSRKPNLALSSTSTTPLEPDKPLIWKSVENLNEITPEIDQEFDDFTKERAEKSSGNVIKKPFPVALEPKVLILNVSPPKTPPSNKTNLTTLEEHEDEAILNKNDNLNSIITDTASSITQFCEESGKKDLTEKDTSRDHNYNALPAKDKQKSLDLTSQNPESNKSFNEIIRPKVLFRSKTGLDNLERRSGLPENKHFLRDRSASIGTLNLNKTPITQLIGEQNRTMLFQVGRSELRLISPDRKQILLQKSFRDIASCVLGRGHRDHFGFICRESSTEGYVCYVFKCESDAISTEVINAIKQAFTFHAELASKCRERSPNTTCEHCPVLWFHRLCHDMEGMNEKKAHAFILRRLEQLPEEEQEQIIVKYQGGTNNKYEVSEHNAFLMMLLRAHCEAKQQRHVHDTAENRSEFLNQYLGGSTIFMKAKRSLSSGFDHLLKRKASKDDLHSSQNQQTKKEPSPLLTPVTSPTTLHPTNVTSPELAVEQAASSQPACDQPSRSKSVSPVTPLTIVTPDVTEPTPPPQPDEEQTVPPLNTYGSPIMDIFLKTGDTKTCTDLSPSDTEDEVGAATWRQAIFQRVISPSAPDTGVEDDVTQASLLGLQSPGEVQDKPGKKGKEQLRELWRMAIGQTVLLVRMERENAKLKEREESSAVRRIKLEYCELGTANAGTAVWDSLLSTRNSLARVEKVDKHMLAQCVRQGVPRMLRGSIWYFLAEQACLRSAPPDCKKFPMYNVPYHTLLSGLTKHQHSILIDLGRTFPQHSYFASALGPGQLALYNLLKAYSLLDPEVGYCQGLSFVAGVLLLHMEEAEAFILLRHLMFRRGLRKQYLPDMSALQVQLYQLSRLLRDQEPELHAHLESLDIAPALYAAPWMLTLFTSQFPLGFVVRVFDMMFLDSMDVVFAVSLALLSAHRDGLMMCDNCEEAAEYLKHKLPVVDEVIYDKVMKKVFSLDVKRQLSEYAVEYGVLREEMPRVAQLESVKEKCRQLEIDKQKVLADLDSAVESISQYQSSQSRLDAQIRSQEQQLMILSKYVLAHQDKKHEMPPDVKRICLNFGRKVGFSSKMPFSSKLSNDLSEEEEDRRTKLKYTGMSTPNLFTKLTKEDVNFLKEKPNVSPENDKKNTMKKSLSVNTGLRAPSIREPLKVLDDKNVDQSKVFSKNEYKSDSIKSDDFIKESLKDIGKKNSGFFSNSHELIRQERLFAQQQKNDFDENLRRLDQKLSPYNGSYMDNLTLFQNQKSMSLNLERKVEKPDSGIGTPLTPLNNDGTDTCSVVSHPLSDCDVNITFDGSTQLKCIRPVKHNIIDIKSPEKTKNAT